MSDVGRKNQGLAAAPADMPEAETSAVPATPVEPAKESSGEQFLLAEASQVSEGVKKGHPSLMWME